VRKIKLKMRGSPGLERKSQRLTASGWNLRRTSSLGKKWLGLICTRDLRGATAGVRTQLVVKYCSRSNGDKIEKCYRFFHSLLLQIVCPCPSIVTGVCIVTVITTRLFQFPLFISIHLNRNNNNLFGKAFSSESQEQTSGTLEPSL
jgi:hypothetical protein